MACVCYNMSYDKKKVRNVVKKKAKKVVENDVK